MSQRLAKISALNSLSRSISLAFLLAFLSASAWGVILEWDPSPSPGCTYAVYWGPNPRGYTNAVNVGTNLTATVLGLRAGSTQYFTVTSISPQGVQSDFSNEIIYTVPVPKTNVVVTMKGATNVLGPWSNIFSLIVTNPIGQQYFRLDITKQ